MATVTEPNSPAKPGIMIVHPRLLDPSDVTSDHFLKWTKLHFRDLLNTNYFPSTDPSSAAPRVTNQCRFAVPHVSPDLTPLSGYSHTDQSLKSPYFYTTIMDDISITQTDPYLGISRALDLEKTRPLLDGEVPVASGRDETAMVWNVVNAEFSVLKLVPSDLATNWSWIPAPQPFQPLPVPLVANARPINTYLIGVTIPSNVALSLGAEEISQFQKNLLSSLADLDSVALFSSVYEYAGDSLQPPYHPEIASTKGAWLILTLVAGEAAKDVEGETAPGDVKLEVTREHVEKVVNQGMLKGDMGARVSWGVWDGELFM